MFKSLSVRLAAVLFGLFLLIGILYILLTLYTTRIYFQEVNQKLNRILAQHLVSERILLRNGRVDEKALTNIFHMLMVVNPVIEVYLLDRDGTIMAFSAPPGKVKRTSVDLGPVKRLLGGNAALPVLGDDPRDLREKKVFSASPIMHDGELQGYLYIILGGEAFESEAQMLRGSHILRLSIWAAAGGLLFALLAALLLFNRMTLRLRQLASAMEMFRQNDFSEPPQLLRRYPVRSGDEIDTIGTIFSQMAGRIVGQIKVLKESDAHRRELVANIAHDLRTPMTSLQGYLETLLMKQDTLSREEQRSYIETAIKRSNQMATLVSELFELAKLDSPDFRARREPFSLDELVQDIVQKFMIAARDKQVRLEMVSNDNLPLVHADVGLVERVLENLIQNALRYTPAGGRIMIYCREKQDRVEVRVSDTGSGIPAENIPRLFDRFSLRERGSRSGQEGSGLGLAITRRILELHGSGIEVESSVGVGTTFTFSLPKDSGRG